MSIVPGKEIGSGVLRLLQFRTLVTLNETIVIFHAKQCLNDTCELSFRPLLLYRSCPVIFFLCRIRKPNSDIICGISCEQNAPFFFRTIGKLLG